MNLSQLGLNRYIIEQIIEGKKPSISNNSKVDLDYLANYWSNIMAMAEEEMKKKPNTKSIAIRLVLEMK